ncbi:hypothetical protein DRN72_05030 [Methanosarcinales archaeon]|nr:MAG: hypothetical protein DRN72_05030 [Methanosarcinales archaeon]
MMPYKSKGMWKEKCSAEHVVRTEIEHIIGKTLGEHMHYVNFLDTIRESIRDSKYFTDKEKERLMNTINEFRWKIEKTLRDDFEDVLVSAVMGK